MRGKGWRANHFRVLYEFRDPVNGEIKPAVLGQEELAPNGEGMIRGWKHIDDPLAESFDTYALAKHQQEVWGGGVVGEKVARRAFDNVAQGFGDIG